MSKEAVMQVRMDSSVKEKAEKLYSSLGTSFAEAIRIFAAQSIEEKRMPFIIHKTNANQKGLGIARGKVFLPDDFDKYNDEISKEFYGGSL